MFLSGLLHLKSFVSALFNILVLEGIYPLLW